MKTILAGCSAAALLALSSVATLAAPGSVAGSQLPAGQVTTIADRSGVDVDIRLGDGKRRRYEDSYYDHDHDADYYRSRGYSRYDRRPDDWRDRGCVGVGPVSFCK